MQTHLYEVPVSLGMPAVLTICHDLNTLPAADEYQLDFSQTQHFEPFGMLLIGSAIRRLQDRTRQNGDKAAVTIHGRSFDKQGHQYAHRLGFWWSVGDDAMLPSVKTEATTVSIPITRLSYKDMFQKAGNRDPIFSDDVANAAADLATTLNGNPDPSPLWIALEYCFREMIRNAFEHGRTDSIWYTGATRPSKDDIQIAFLDSGRGIRESLSDNPNENHSTDMSAVRASLEPGVSRNTGRTVSPALQQKRQEEFPGTDPSRYENSGYGLTLTSRLGREAGQFAIVSGAASLAYVNNYEATSNNTLHVGTAVRIVLHPTKLEGVLDKVFDEVERHVNGKPRSGSLITASMMKRLGIPRNDP